MATITEIIATTTTNSIRENPLSGPQESNFIEDRLLIAPSRRSE